MRHDLWDIWNKSFLIIGKYKYWIALQILNFKLAFYPEKVESLFISGSVHDRTTPQIFIAKASQRFLMIHKIIIHVNIILDVF